MYIDENSRETVYNSSIYSKMIIHKECSIYDHASIVRDLKSKGYIERYRNACRDLSIGIYENETEVVTLIRNAVSHDVRVIAEDKKYNCLDNLYRSGERPSGELTLSQIGVSSHGIYKDCPMIGMFCLIKLSDGRAIIIDGGALTDGGADDVYHALESHEIIKNNDGQYEIAAWVLTHNHDDHMGSFVTFARKYSHAANVGQILYSFPNDERLVCGGYELSTMENAFDECFPTARRVIPRGGASYAYGNAVLRFLMTGETQYSDASFMRDHNDASLTFMLEAEGVKVLFLADAGEETAEKMLECLDPGELSCDILQIPHHGLFTGAFKTQYSPDEYAVLTIREKDALWNQRFEHEYLDCLYTLADPSIALLPMGDTNGNPGCGRSTVLYDWPDKYGQLSYFLDMNDEKKGYDGVNVVKKIGLTTYIASSEDDQMITRFSFKDGLVDVLDNVRLSDFNNNMGA